MLSSASDMHVVTSDDMTTRHRDRRSDVNATYRSIPTVVRQSPSQIVTSEFTISNATLTEPSKDILHPDSSHHRLPTLVLVIIIAVALTGVALSVMLIVRRRLFIKKEPLVDYDEPWEVESTIKGSLPLSTLSGEARCGGPSTLEKSRPSDRNISIPERYPTGRAEESPDSIHAMHSRDPSRAQSIAPSVFFTETARDQDTIVADDSISVVWERTQRAPR